MLWIIIHILNFQNVYLKKQIKERIRYALKFPWTWPHSKTSKPVHIDVIDMYIGLQAYLQGKVFKCLEFTHGSKILIWFFIDMKYETCYM